MKERILNAIVWLRRIASCRGFGIQSPSAYMFVRYVINEHYSYYCYNELRQTFPNIDFTYIKLFRLYFRLVNYIQPKVVFDISDSLDEVRDAYYLAAKRDIELIRIYLPGNSSLNKVDMIRIKANDDSKKIFNRVCTIANSSTLLIIENIYWDKISKEFWKHVISDNRVGVTYDLYYCGIVMFDLKKYKKNYIINF